MPMTRINATNVVYLHAHIFFFLFLNRKLISIFLVLTFSF